MASSVRLAALRVLTTLDGVIVLAPEVIDPVPGPALDVLRAVAADEALTSTLDCGAVTTCQVTLRRLASDGRLLWTERVAVDIARPFLAAEAIAVHLERGYAELRPVGEITDLQVPAADYGNYRFNKERRDDDLDLAFAALRRARELAPRDPRPLASIFTLALSAGDLDRAAVAVAELERLEPGDPSVVMRRARLIEKQGQPQEALRLMRAAVTARRSWRALLHLAWMEVHQGEIEAARAHLEELLSLFPGQRTGQALLAQIELLYGDPERAAEIYTQLIERAPQASELANLGTAYLLLGRFAAAAILRGRRMNVRRPGRPTRSAKQNFREVDIMSKEVSISSLVAQPTNQDIITIGGAITGTQLTGNYHTLQNNLPQTYNNFVGLWQGVTVPYGNSPQSTAAPGTDSPDGGYLFQNVQISLFSYIVGYGTGDSLGDSQSIATTVSFPKGGGQPTVFSTTVGLVSYSANSVILNYSTPPGNQPVTNKNWVGIWEGQNVPFNGSQNLGWSWVSSSGNAGNAAIGNITLLRGTTYTVAYATDPAWSGIAATYTFST